MDDDLADTVVGARRAPAARHSRDVLDEDTVVRSATSVVSADGRERRGPTPEVPRHRFRLNGGEPVPTDVPTIIGRSPRVPRVPGAGTPRLLIVPSPAQEVSGTHLELRQEGASIVVTDLRSTNGTVIEVPGSPRRALRPGESFVAGPGSVIDIGDGNIIEVLPGERLVPGRTAERTS